MIPIMLLVKPLIIYCRRSKKPELPKSDPDLDFDNLDEEKMEEMVEGSESVISQKKS